MPARRLPDKQEERQQNVGPEMHKSIVKDITSENKTKDKKILLRINSSTYEKFQRINNFYGQSNNSVINMLIAEYVRTKKDIILNDEDLLVLNKEEL